MSASSLVSLASRRPPSAAAAPAAARRGRTSPSAGGGGPRRGGGVATRAINWDAAKAFFAGGRMRAKETQLAAEEPTPLEPPPNPPPFPSPPQEINADDPIAQRVPVSMDDMRIVVHAEVTEAATAEGRAILCAIQDVEGPASQSVMLWARDNLWRPGDVLNLLHVNPFFYDPTPGPTLGGSITGGNNVYIPDRRELRVLDEKAVKDMADRAINCLESGAPDDFAYKMLTANEPAVSSVAETILQVAELEGADQLVVADRARASLDEIMLGSVSKYLVRHCKTCPVVLVHTPGSPAMAEPADAEMGSTVP